MEQSPTFKSNLNSEMSDLVHRAEEWALLPQIPKNEDPQLQKIFKEVLYRVSMMLLKTSGVKTVNEFHNVFDPILAEQEKCEKEEKDVIENLRQNSMCSTSLEDLQFHLKRDWTELLEEPLSSVSPFDRRRRTSMFSDLNRLSPIVSEASHSPEKVKRPSTIHSTPLRSFKKPLFSSMSTPKTPWRRGNSMYVEDVANKTMIVTPRKSLSTSRLNRQSPAPMPGETPLENRASRLRRMKLEEKIRGNQFG
ncbi:hypothetical protein CAEBREN_00076 [Caenorhabditis brenneri]|uniref:Uncharacterized protein n=1 Tax=Caenorhabditis brenneri TaxID=135651 RepID=G0MKD1_CAEBE|nr:hypothetical protein CAEBREN_00076 [Caenorhabditis brenneri]